MRARFKFVGWFSGFAFAFSFWVLNFGFRARTLDFWFCNFRCDAAEKVRGKADEEAKHV
jgi:hypothetical protein